jgi:hypothetical protein
MYQQDLTSLFSLHNKWLLCLCVLHTNHGRNIYIYCDVFALPVCNDVLVVVLVRVFATFTSSCSAFWLCSRE